MKDNQGKLIIEETDDFLLNFDKINSKKEHRNCFYRHLSSDSMTLENINP